MSRRLSHPVQSYSDLENDAKAHGPWSRLPGAEAVGSKLTEENNGFGLQLPRAAKIGQFI